MNQAVQATITKSRNFKEYQAKLRGAGKTFKGDSFELLTWCFFKIDPKLRQKYKEVYLRDDAPASLLKKHNLRRPDKGIDLFAVDWEGNTLPIQSKYRSNVSLALTYGEDLSTYLAESFAVARGFDRGCVATTTKDISEEVLRAHKPSFTLTHEDFSKLDKEFFDAARELLETGNAPVPEKRTPRDYQKDAIKAASKHFSRNNRGRMIKPTGTGKTLSSWFIFQKFAPQKAVFLAPTIDLVRQTLEVYSREAVANKTPIDFLCVCSDVRVNKNVWEDFERRVAEVGVEVTTDSNKIANFLSKRRSNPAVIFSTYHSADVVGRATKKTHKTFDLGIFDEAHHTTGDKSKMFSFGMDDKNLPIRKRLFMTATERVYEGEETDVLTMDDEKQYGKRFFELTFPEAEDLGCIVPRRVVAVGVSDERVRQLIAENEYLNDSKNGIRQMGADTIASCLSILELLAKRKRKKALCFFSRNKNAEDAADLFRKLQRFIPGAKRVKIFTVNGTSMNSAERAEILAEFEAADKAILTNAKCLTEGIDLPDIDVVAFIDPRHSVIDITQAVGRGCRPANKKEDCLVWIPVVLEGKEQLPDKHGFKRITNTILGLAATDSRIVEQFILKTNHKRTGKRSEKERAIVEVRGVDLDVEKLSKAIHAKVTSVGLRRKVVPWLPFEEARAFVHGRELGGVVAWRKWIKSKDRPLNLPSTPYLVYADRWVNFGDWLGTGRLSDAERSKNFRSFKEARKFARGLGLKNRKEWDQYVKPADIPAKPEQVYKEEWVNLSDFLGSARIRNTEWRPFEDARKFAQGLKLSKTEEWFSWCKSGKRLKDIPAGPSSIYKDEWLGWGDWLGTGYTSRKSRLPFEEAREIVRAQKLKNLLEWREWSKNKRPASIPAAPMVAYEDQWRGLQDWLGYEKVSTRPVPNWRPFGKARKFVRSLGLKKQDEWSDYCKSAKRPADIPTHPDRSYKDQWKGMKDWLGTE